MKNLIKLWIITYFPFTILPALAHETTAFGIWKTEDGQTKIEIKACKENPQEICGTVFELQEPHIPETGKEKTDHLNPDEALRHRKILGLAILSGLKMNPDKENSYIEGEIYDPREGKTYSCEMTLINAHTLEVHGYFGLSIIGKTETWTRTSVQEKLTLINK